MTSSDAAHSTVRVSAIVVSHDGARWLPLVLQALGEQTRPPDRVIAVDTGSTDGSLTELTDALGSEAVIELPATAGFSAAVNHAAEVLARPATSTFIGNATGADPAESPLPEFLWLLHDDSRPAPDALERLLDTAAHYPATAIFGPKLREWPSLRRLLELGVTITGTGNRETGLERGEFDQGQHDSIRRVLAVNTAGMLIRREVFDALGGLDEVLPIFGNDIDLGWRAAEAGHTTMAVPEAVVFHAEAASRGVRRTALTGGQPHYAQRRAAIFTLLANAPAPMLLLSTIRIAFGTLLRVLGFVLIRSPRLAGDELAAVVSVYARPGAINRARRKRRERWVGEPRSVRHLLAPWWLPYRHGLDLLGDLANAVTNQANDVAERRRAARLADDPRLAAAAKRSAQRVAAAGEADEDDEVWADSGLVARFLTNPLALAITGFVLVTLVAARHALLPANLVGGALSPTPATAGSWWRLYLEHWHTIGTGSDVPAPTYLAVLGLPALALGPGGVMSALFLMAVPLALWGAYRFIKVLGRLVDPRGLPRPLLLWAAITYALLPVVTGAWGQGRFGTVAAFVLLPWAAHAALGFAEPEADRRWRAAWRTALALALIAAFVPALWLFAVLLTAIGLLVAAVIGRQAQIPLPRSVWLPPVVAVALTPLLLSPWLVGLMLSGSTQGLLLEAGRIPVPAIGPWELASGRLGEPSAPLWLGGVLAVLALLALIPRATRIAVLAAWLVGLAAALAGVALSRTTVHLPALDTRPSLSFAIVVMQGAAVVACAIGADAFVRRTSQGHPWWQRSIAMILSLVALVIPVSGLIWWLQNPQGQLTADTTSVVPVYMQQASALGPEHGVLVVRGDVRDGVSWRIRRGDGVTVGEDEILTLAHADPEVASLVRALVSQPTGAVIAGLAAHGVEYVVLPAPVDGVIAAALDATTGLAQASAEDRSTRAWQLEDSGTAPSAAKAMAEAGSGVGTTVRVLTLILQAVLVLVAVVMALPTLRPASVDSPSRATQGRRAARGPTEPSPGLLDPPHQPVRSTPAQRREQRREQGAGQ